MRGFWLRQIVDRWIGLLIGVKSLWNVTLRDAIIEAKIWSEEVPRKGNYQVELLFCDGEWGCSYGRPVDENGEDLLTAKVVPVTASTTMTNSVVWYNAKMN